jgi:hypothetical protein
VGIAVRLFRLLERCDRSMVELVRSR